METTTVAGYQPNTNGPTYVPPTIGTTAAPVVNDIYINPGATIYINGYTYGSSDLVRALTQTHNLENTPAIARIDQNCEDMAHLIAYLHQQVLDLQAELAALKLDRWSDDLHTLLDAPTPAQTASSAPAPITGSAPNKEVSA